MSSYGARDREGDYAYKRTTAHTKMLTLQENERTNRSAREQDSPHPFSNRETLERKILRILVPEIR